LADSAPAFVRELNSVLLPTLGSPTIPNFIFYMYLLIFFISEAGTAAFRRLYPLPCLCRSHVPSGPASLKAGGGYDRNYFITSAPVSLPFYQKSFDSL
jgi:hypothetical protein